MRKIKWVYSILVFGVCLLKAQQLPHYTQFLFNKGGYNPAANGTSLSQPYDVVFGGRTQWIGLKNNPKSIFINANYTFIPQRSYKNWHNAGIYIDQDQAGVMIHNSVYASYAFHLLLSKNTVMSMGVHAGMKQFLLSRNSLDPNDPAVAKSSGSIFAIPDIVPGLRLYNKKFFLDFSLWHITKFRQKGIGGQIGSPSVLVPHYYIGAGRRFTFGEMANLVVAGNVYSSAKSVPSVELNVMSYWYKRFAYGLSVRNVDFVCGIIQFRLVNSLVVGLAYDLSVNRLSRVAPHTVEVMIGVSPLFGNNAKTVSYSKRIANCPDLSF